MNRQQALRFEAEYTPRIAECVARLLGRAERNDAIDHGLHYAFDLNVTLTWDDDEIERLLMPGGEARFVRYSM